MQTPVASLTSLQKTMVSILIVVMAIDAIISIDGAWNHNSTFYEANPIFAAFGNVEWFTIGVIALKIVAISMVVVLISEFNKEPGIEWGNALACGSTFCFTMLVATMGVINMMI